MSNVEEDQKMPTAVDVWVQLAYREGKNDGVSVEGSVFKIAKFSGDVADLVEAVKTKLADSSIHISVVETKVYRLKEGVPLPSEENETLPLINCEGLNPRTEIESLRLTRQDTLIVVAPKPHPQNQPTTKPQETLRQNDDNILGDGVYAKLTNAVCFFRDQESSPIGSGFAISPTRVYSVAHNFVDPAVGSEVICHFGKPNQHIMRRVTISSVDIRMDYCTLDIVEGEVNLPDHLEVSTDPLEPGKNCILAAFQIGIQQDLKDLDPDLSIGVFKGEIAKLYPRHFVYQCPSFAGDSGGAIVLRDGRAVGIHQETVIQARERIQHGDDLDADARLESVEASVDELIRSLSSGSIGLQLVAIR